MAFDGKQMVRIAKRMRQATGYLEIGMPQQALDRLELLGALGPFEAEVELLRGEAMRMQHRYEEAAASFAIAARKFPPESKAAWLALSLCCRQAGDSDRAVKMLGLARGAKPPEPGPHCL
ncbi:MAG: tetratricopeptide repeat protein [Pirellulales bacterium]|nr:tetratricopeptide repeat protein [Pirellulales bacterium]